jgi:urea carboxylase-associated protein 2
VSEPILDAVLPPAATWSRVCRRATALTLTDLDGGANVACLLYRAGAPHERYCMPDTLKAQHVSRLTAGVALYSDMGRVLASITSDTVGWHDTITGHTTQALVDAKWGHASYQEHRNAWQPGARDQLLIELAKHGMDRRDLVANINVFSKVAVGPAGELSFVSDNSAAGDHVTVRFELDTLVLLCSVPHPLDPSPEWRPGAVGLRLEPVPAAAADDPVRVACAENTRGFAATELELA